MQKLVDRGFKHLKIDTESKIDPSLLEPFEIVLSCIGPEGQLSQLNLATASKAAGVKRFVPCGYITICPPGGIMENRDQKEEVNNHILRLKLPYTYIDTGFWHLISFPKLPSGRTDDVHLYGGNEIYAGGDAPNLLVDLRDIGRFVARIIKDPRTLNKRVFMWSDELSQNEIYAISEEMSGEKIKRDSVSAEAVEQRVQEARAAFTASEKKAGVNTAERMAIWSSEYIYSKYVRADNSRENALYLGYLDARELYPQFKPSTFRDFFAELLEGGIERPYQDKYSKEALENYHSTKK